MFLDLIRRRNPSARRATRSRCIRPARFPPTPMSSTSTPSRRTRGPSRASPRQFGLKVYAMTKQMGRNGSFCNAVAKGGIDKAVAVDMECARATRRAGLGLGHIGHLVQVPRHEADAAASMTPDHWTVVQSRKGGGSGSSGGKVGPDAGRTGPHRCAGRYVLPRP